MPIIKLDIPIFFIFFLMEYIFYSINYKNLRRDPQIYRHLGSQGPPGSDKLYFYTYSFIQSYINIQHGFARKCMYNIF